MVVQSSAIPILRFEELPSTSDLARELVGRGGLDGARLLVATRQTGGRGRFGRPWASPEGGLWCTLIWPLDADGESGAAEAEFDPSGRRRPARRHEILQGLGLRLGIACVRTIDDVMLAHRKAAVVQLKWPNDVYVNGRKALGLLTEVITRGRRLFVLVGVGVNVNMPLSALPPEVQPRAATLRDVIGAEVSMDALIRSLLNHLRWALTERGLSRQLIFEIRARLHGVGEPAVVNLPSGERISGVLRGVTDTGQLTLETPNGLWTAPEGAEVAMT